MDRRGWLALGALLLAIGVLPVGLSCGGLARFGGDAAMSPAPAMEAAPAAGEDSDGAVTTWKRSTLSPNTSRLRVGDDTDLPLRSLKASARIDGFRARVVIDFLFENDRGGDLEGTFQVRLPDEASPYFFAFGEHVLQAAGTAGLVLASGEAASDSEPRSLMAERAEVWRGPKEARVVPRETAALAYTETTRRRVDPALMEWAGGGVFNARVYPIAAKKLHRIVIGYDVDLVRAGKDAELLLELPEVGNASVDVSVAEHALSGLNVVPEREGTSGGGRKHFRFEDAEARSVRVRLTPAPGLVLTGREETGSYFATRFVPTLPANPGAAGAPEAVFLVDTSLSENPDKYNVSLKLLRAILDENRATLRRFAVMFFNVEQVWFRPAWVDNTSENVETLLQFAGRLPLEGATDLGAAVHAVTASALLAGAPTPRDLFLLADGNATWGESEPYALSRALERAPHLTLFAYRTGMPGSDTKTLSHLARQSGGAVFSVVGAAEVAAAATAHRSRPWRIERIEAAGTSDVLLAGRPTAIYPGQALTLGGRGAPTGKIWLDVEQGGKRQRVEVPTGRTVDSPLAPRVYGQLAVDQLEELTPATTRVAIAYATQFRVTGKTCSLLMLESEEDYRRYRIEPAAPLIATETVSALIERVLDKTRRALGDPKESFFAFITELEQGAQNKTALPPALVRALRARPASEFEVRVPPLKTRLRDRAQLGAALAAELSRQEPSYKVVTAEAERRLSLGPDDALKALSSLVEAAPGDGVLARDVGYSALAWKRGGQAYHLFRRVARARPYEPQSYRAMADALTELGKTDLAMAYLELGYVGQWDARFGDFRQIIAMDYLRLLRRIARGELTTSVPEYARWRLGTLADAVALSSADLVVMITWNTDNTDVDLHVIEPTGEDCHYANRTTRIGGRLSQDVTQGYGPEMYVLERARPGKYRVEANYFASDAGRLGVRTKVHVTVIENYGTPRERVTQKLVSLAEGKERHAIVTVER